MNRGRVGWRWLGPLVVIVLIGAAVYLPRLGSGGLTSTEGHRAIPGWGMLQSGDWLVPRMFGQMYLRKPPGMPWAIAASSAIFGPTEFAARLPSALATIALAAVIAAFAGRWFGRGAALAAGIATLLTPWFWSSGRSAEIEALNNGAAGAAVLLTLELLVNRGARSWWGSLLIAGLLADTLIIAALAKGPAAFAAIGSAAIVGMASVGLGTNEPRPVARIRGGLWLMAAIVPAAVAIAGLYALIMGRAAEIQRETAQAPVMQEVTEFLWRWSTLSAGRVLKVILMGPSALAAALPASLALLLLLRRPRIDVRGDERADRLAASVAWSSLLSLLVLAVLGVGNPRYAMPSMSFVPVLAGYAWLRLSPLELRRARAVGTAALAVGLSIGAIVWVTVLEPRQRGRSGLASGEALGQVLPAGAMVWADGVVEARPEVFWYAQREALRQGRDLRVVWIPNLAALKALPREGYLLLRTDELGNEAEVFRDAGLMDRLHPVWEGWVHKYTYTLYRKEFGVAP